MSKFSDFRKQPSDAPHKVQFPKMKEPPPPPNEPPTAVAPDEPPEEDMEQRIRDFYGYSSSEKRGWEERARAAARMADADEEAYVEERRTRLIRDNLMPISEDEYVAREVEITKAYMDLPEGDKRKLKDVTDNMGRNRLERTAAYARWRYREFRARRVDSL